jgi:hypothetical protein
MLLEYIVTDRNGTSVVTWAHGEQSATSTKLGIRDKIINTFDLSLEPFSIQHTGGWKHDSDNQNIIQEVIEQ